jgi:uncharacterized protein DUF6950
MRQKRNADWQRMLNAYIAKSQERYISHGIIWGKFDCCTFAFDWVMECTGIDPMLKFRGNYSSKKQALSLLRKTGKGTLLKTIEANLSLKLHSSHCQRGDIAYRNEEKAVGIFITQGARSVAVFLGEGGFSVLPASDVSYGFPV